MYRINYKILDNFTLTNGLNRKDILDKNGKYVLNFYDYLLNKIVYHYDNPQVLAFIKAKIFLEDLNKKNVKSSEKDMLDGFEFFIKEMSYTMLGLTRADIEDIVLTVPILLGAEEISVDELEKSKDSVCIVDFDSLDSVINFNNVYKEFSAEELEVLDSRKCLGLLFRKAYWLRYLVNRGYHIIFKSNLERSEMI